MTDVSKLFLLRAKNAQIMKYNSASYIFNEHLTSHKIRQYKLWFTMFLMDFHPFFARDIGDIISTFSDSD